MTVAVLVVGSILVTADPTDLPAISAAVVKQLPGLTVRTVTVLDDRFVPPVPPRTL